MANHLLSRADTGLPVETIAEVQDGIALALDALGGRRVTRSAITEALGHLRWAHRRAETITPSEGV